MWISIHTHIYTLLNVTFPYIARVNKLVPTNIDILKVGLHVILAHFPCEHLQKQTPKLGIS